MLKNQNIIVFSDDWGRHPFSCQHIMENLLPFNTILWVNTIGYRKISFNIYDIKRSFGKISNWFRPKSSPPPQNGPPGNLHIINPVCIPFGHFSFVRFFNKISIIKACKGALTHLAFQYPLLITTLPTTENIVGHLGERFSIYYCVDDFTLWPGADFKLMRELEDNLISKVDLIIATSEKLAQTRYNGRRPTELLTHGVDLDHFNVQEHRKQVSEVPDLPPPVVAYYGLIDERCDLSLIAFLANSMRSVTFLIIGAWRVDLSPIVHLPNVKITGRVDYHDLPKYLSQVSSLLLPYHVNQLSTSINPLKLKEYLATGFPILSTPLPEVIKLKRFIHICRDYEHFKQTLQETIKTTTPIISKKLSIFLEGQTWEKKAECFSDMIEKI